MNITEENITGVHEYHRCVCLNFTGVHITGMCGALEGTGYSSQP